MQENDSSNDQQSNMPLRLESQLEALDKAKEVEGFLDEAVKMRQEEMQKQGI